MINFWESVFLLVILCGNLFGCASTNCSAIHSQKPEYEECVAEENAKLEAASTLTKVGIEKGDTIPRFNFELRWI